MPRFIDTHCHINSLPESVQKEIIQLSISSFCFFDVSIDISSTVKSLALSNKHSHIYSFVGFHPFSIKEYSTKTVGIYRQYIQENIKKVKAIGEIGLDYKAEYSFALQQKVLHEFIELAKEFNLPVVIHARGENLPLFKILDKYYPNSYNKIIFHCFSQDEQILESIIEREGFVSFSLNVFRKRKELLDCLKKIPEKNLLLETDSPYMRYKGELSSPKHITILYEFCAQLRNTTIDQLKMKIEKNVERILGQV